MVSEGNRRHAAGVPVALALTAASAGVAPAPDALVVFLRSGRVLASSEQPLPWLLLGDRNRAC